MLNAVAEILIPASYRLGFAFLLQQLQKTMQREEVSGAQLVIIGNFIVRLGYANIEEAQRPASRVQKRQLFSPQRRVRQCWPSNKADERLSTPPAAMSGDWLVALYTPANENAGYRHPQDVTDADRAINCPDT
ncbi:hypothetical protein KCP74_17920 [Salmonella enterica subsp. enterica]|nr:hypothetical protein KCP74_17920 [Salmonella enterica subsp. enterica]